MFYPVCVCGRTCFGIQTFRGFRQALRGIWHLPSWCQSSDDTCFCVGRSRDLFRVQRFAARTDRIQHVVMLMAMIYNDKTTHSKISQDKRLKGRSPEETRHTLPRVPSHWVCLTSPAANCDNTRNTLSANRSSLEAQRPGFLLGTQHINILSASHIHNSRLPRRKNRISA